MVQIKDSQTVKNNSGNEAFLQRQVPHSTLAPFLSKIDQPISLGSGTRIEPK